MARLLLFGWLIAFPAWAIADPPGGTLVLRLCDHAVTRSRVVCVNDLAQLSGGTHALREHVARLDVAEITHNNTGLVLSAKQVGFRLRLAGLPPQVFRIEGEAAHVTARFRTVTPEDVVARTREELLRGLPWAPSEVQVTLVQPLVAPLPALADDEQLVIKATPRPGSRPPGRVQMDVQLFVQGKSLLSLPLYFDIRPCVPVAVCKRQVAQGRELTDADIYIEQQPVTGGTLDLLTPDAVKGRKARRTLLPGHPVRPQDVEESKASKEMPLIKAQEAVKLRVRVGGLSLQMLGKALQEGRMGQLIRVENADSKKALMGRVAGPALVEIE